MRDRFSFYTEISKIEEQTDGTLKVYGIASSDAKDSDGEITNPEAFKAALPDFFRTGPALREMHQLIAAGSVIEASVDDAGKANICAHVVDAGSVAKVKTGVLRGFSWAGPVLKRRTGDPHILDKIKINEISLVDRPANPEALISVWKAEKDVAKKGMWDVSRIAELLAELAWLQQCAVDEAFWENDASEIPAKLGANVKDLGETLKEMLGEEIAELTATMASKAISPITVGATMKIPKAQRAAFSAFLLAHADEAAKALGTTKEKLDETLKAASATDDASDLALKAAASAMENLHKAMSTHRDAIGEAHKGMIECCSKAEDMIDGEDEGKKAARTTEREKRALDASTSATDLAEKLAKAETEKTALVASHTTEIADKDEAIKALKDTADELVSRLQAKGILRGGTAIDKTADTGADPASKGKKDEEAPTDPMKEIRAAHKDGERFRAPAAQ